MALAMKREFALLATAALPWALSACASTGAYPSLAIRDAERVTGSAQLPASPATFTRDELSGKCDATFLGSDAQLVTVENFEGPESYDHFDALTEEVEALEGEVVKARVAGKDNYLNHDSHDATFDGASHTLAGERFEARGPG